MFNKSANERQWQHPKELLKIQKLKLKKQALQERIKGNSSIHKESSLTSTNNKSAFENVFNSKKRKNPFAKEDSNEKRVKTEDVLTETVDETLFKILNQNAPDIQNTPVTSFSGLFTKLEADSKTEEEKVEIQQAQSGTPWCPIDWTLKRRIRLISLKPFPWSQKLKISEEASGITSFTRCLDIEQCNTSLDASPNAKFHQCCLYWQQPFLPWLTLFPRNTVKNNTSGFNLASSSVIKNCLYETWTDSLKSLYQLIRTRQCPYFYVCANSFTAIFRAAGMFGHPDLHVMVTPTTRGFRHLLKEEDIEFEMPLKVAQHSENLDSSGLETEEKCLKAEPLDNEDDDDDNTLGEEWLSKLGVNADDIKAINYTQARIEHKTECQVDSSDQSLILVEGIEVNSFFNFLINCKSAIATTGPLAGVPPTLLAPVSFHGATLNALKVRENKIHSDGLVYYCLELNGPILPSTIHNIFNINNTDHSITVTFNDIESTRVFSRVLKKQKRRNTEQKSTAIFGKENLSDCGLNCKVLKHFCSADPEIVCNVECLKYSGDTQTFTWT